MGAFDTFIAVVPCPECGTRYWEDCQTKFFCPDYHDQACLRPGQSKSVDLDPAHIDGTELWESEWLKIGEHARSEAFTYLLPDWEIRTCFCGTTLAPVARVELRSTGKDKALLTLIALELWDLRRPETVERLDFVGDDWPRRANGSSFQQADLEALAARPRGARRDAIASAFQRIVEERAALDSSDHHGWSSFGGPARCESCGLTRASSTHTPITHPEYRWSFFGDAWAGGEITPGTRIHPVPPELATERLRCSFYRVREPVPTELVLLHSRAHHGCRCGAGRASPLARFSREGDTLTLEEITWRVVRSRSDLTDVDWVETRWINYLSRPDVGFEDGWKNLLRELSIPDT